MKQMTIFDYPREITTIETRRESEAMVDKSKRYQQIIDILKEVDKPMSAKQIAVRLCEKGYIPTSERNFVSPRLTELREQGIVECMSKIICEYTHKPVATFRLRKEGKET